MRRVALTGAGGGVTLALARELTATPGIEAVISVGPAAHAAPGIEHHRRSPGEPVADLFLERWIDGVIHLAHAPGEPAQGLLPALERTLEGCHRAGIPRLVLGSSALVYGPSWERPAPRPETAPREGGRLGLRWVSGLIAAEALAERFAQEHPELELAIARPARLVGGGEDDLVTLLAAPVCPLPRPLAPLQVCHVDDYARALAALAQAPTRGALNVAAGEVLGADEIAGCAAGRVVWLPLSAVEKAIAAGDRLAPLPLHELRPRLETLAAPWLVDPQRSTEALGLRFERPGALALRAAVTERTVQSAGRARRLLGWMGR